MKKETDILEVEEKILNNLDNLDKLFDEYLNLDNKPNKTINPIGWIRKIFVLKKIKTEIHNLNDNILLLVKIQEDCVSRLTGKEFSDINANVDIIVEKLINIAPKYAILKIKYDKNYEINNEWYFFQYLICDQDQLTQQFNDKFAKDTPEYQLKSILAEIMKICKLKGIDYNMFLTRGNLLREDIKRGRIS